MPSFPYSTRITSNGTDVFTFISTEDTISQSVGAYVLQHASTGTLVAEKNLSGAGYTIDNISGIAPDYSGKIVAVSSYFDATAFKTKTYIVRLNQGTLAYDNSFNLNGRKTLTFGTSNSNYSRSFLIQSSDNKIVTASEESSSFNKLSLARINAGPVVTTGINQRIDEKSAFVYPNPANHILFISVPENCIAEARLYDLNGKLVLTKQFENNTELLINNLLNGIYLMQVIYINNSTQLLSKKNIIQH